MKSFRQVGMLTLLLLGGAACGRKVYLPRPPQSEQEGTMADQKKIAKLVDRYAREILKLQLKQSNLGKDLVEKRTNGYNTSEAETVMALADEAIAQATDFNYWAQNLDQFEELDAKLKEIELFQKKAKNLIKNAPEFGDKPAKKEKAKERKYGLDDREWVRELKGEPDALYKQTRGPATIHLSIFGLDPSSPLRASPCWEEMMSSFVISNPPGIESWFYPGENLIYIFMEVNSIVEQFMMRNSLTNNERDELLYRFCSAQVYSGWKLIYVGNPVADVSSIPEQVFTGKMRFSGMFGLEGMERIAKATAVIPDLTVASVAFNAEIDPLNKLQAQQFDNFFQLIANTDQALDPALAKFFEDFKGVREGGESSEEKDKKIKALIRGLNHRNVKRYQAFSKITKWQKTLDPSRKDADELAKLFPGEEEKIRSALIPLAKTLLALKKEFDVVNKELLRFDNRPSERVFPQGKPPAVFFLLDGVRFDEKVLGDGSKADLLDVSVKIKVEVKLGEKEPPVLVREIEEIKIASASILSGARRDDKKYHRLVRFGIKFPVDLFPASYLVTFLVTDNLRAQTIEQEVDWLIVPPQD